MAAELATPWRTGFPFHPLRIDARSGHLPMRIIYGLTGGSSRFVGTARLGPFLIRPSVDHVVTPKLFIRTFGCQMNEYDSDKMADVLQAADGYEKTDDVEQADLVLYNSCSVREKAAEKMFSDLGRIKHLKAKGVLIGVGGCVASQEGAAI